jgi:hypothetical protein
MTLKRQLDYGPFSSNESMDTQKILRKVKGNRVHFPLYPV